MDSMTAAPTSTLIAAPTKEHHNMYLPQRCCTHTRPARRHWSYDRLGEYIDTVPPEYDDLSSYALAAADEAIQAHALGEISDSAFDESFAAALKMDRAPVQVSAPWPFSEADELALEEIQAASRPKAYTPPVNGLTEVDRLSIAAARRQEADAEYAVMLAEQERIEELSQIDFSTVRPLVQVPEYDFSDLCTMEVAA